MPHYSASVFSLLVFALMPMPIPAQIMTPSFTRLNYHGPGSVKSTVST